VTEQKVYITGHDNPRVQPGDLYKIGIATDPHKRHSILQGGTPYKLKLITTITPKRDAKQLEHRLHQLFRTQRFRGEWFTLFPRQLNALRKKDTLSASVIKKAYKETLGPDKSILYENPEGLINGVQEQL